MTTETTETTTTTQTYVDGLRAKRWAVIEQIIDGASDQEALEGMLEWLNQEIRRLTS